MSTQITTFVHPRESELINVHLCSSRKLPSLVILTFVKSGDLACGVTKSPFYFPHSKLRELSFFCNGVERKFEMDISGTQHCTSVLKSLYHQLGYRKEEISGNLFTLDRLRNGFFFSVQRTLLLTKAVLDHLKIWICLAPFALRES